MTMRLATTYVRLRSLNSKIRSQPVPIYSEPLKTGLMKMRYVIKNLERPVFNCPDVLKDQLTDLPILRLGDLPQEQSIRSLSSSSF